MPNFSLKHRNGTLNRGSTLLAQSSTQQGERLKTHEIHTMFGGDVQLFRRQDSDRWHARTSINGHQWRKSTGEESLDHAKDIAEDWYLDLHGKKRVGELKTGKTFAEAAKKFEKEYEAITTGRRSPKWVQGHKDRIRLHLNPFLGKRLVAGINSGAVQDYRVHRMTKPDSVVKTEHQAVAEGLEITPWNLFLKMFNRVMTDADLKFDRHGKARTSYSLRHTYICLRLLEGADIYQVAKNCRTSVEMIEKHYAAHLKDMIDTSLVNVRKPKMNGKKPTSPTKSEE